MSGVCYRSGMRITDELLDRLWRKVEVKTSTECWPFTGYLLKGYGRIGLGGRKDGVAYAHRVVCHVAHGECPPGHSARHLCGNRACCNPAHLKWGTQSENESDKVEHERTNRGQRHGMSKLTADDVLTIRRLPDAGVKQAVIAAQFGIRQQHVSEIVRRKVWAWL